MKRYLAVATMALLLSACGGDGGGGTGDVPTVVSVTAGCDVPQAGQCATISASQAAWDSVGGQAAWAKECAVGINGFAGTVVAECPVASRLGRCAVTYLSGANSAVAVYVYYSPTYTAERAAQTCAAIQGTFTGG